MILRTFVLAAFGGLLAVGCQRPAATPAAQAASVKPTAAPRTLRFGSGGGIVGSVTAYSLTADGQLSRRRGMPGDTSQPATRLTAPPADAVARCFRALDALPADSLTVRQPGNMYYFLEGRTAAGKLVALTWGAPGGGVPRGARALYRDLTALVPAGN